MSPGISTWQIVGGPGPTSLSWVGPAAAYGAQLPMVTTSTFSYYAVQALNAGGQVMATSAPVPDPPTSSSSARARSPRIRGWARCRSAASTSGRAS